MNWCFNENCSRLVPSTHTLQPKTDYYISITMENEYSNDRLEGGFPFGQLIREPVDAFFRGPEYVLLVRTECRAVARAGVATAVF